MRKIESNSRLSKKLFTVLSLFTLSLPLLIGFGSLSLVHEHSNIIQILHFSFTHFTNVTKIKAWLPFFEDQASQVLLHSTPPNKKVNKY